MGGAPSLGGTPSLGGAPSGLGTGLGVGLGLGLGVSVGEGGGLTTGTGGGGLSFDCMAWQALHASIDICLSTAVWRTWSVQQHDKALM